MKKAFIGAIVISLAFALPGFAAGGNQLQKPAGPRFEERKADILKRIDERIANDQQQKACVQAAKNAEDLKVCREKYAPHRPRGQGRPGGQSGSGGQPRPEAQ